MIRVDPQRVAPLSLHPTLIQGIMSRCVRIVRVPLAELPPLERDDLIWVREAIIVPKRQPAKDHLAVTYLADASRVGVRWPPAIARPGPGMRLADHMPRAASRLTLAVDSYRVLRLHEVDDAAALAMGVLPHPDGGWMNPALHAALYDAAFEPEFETARDAYQAMWQFIYDAEIPWIDNSEVAEIQFTATARNIDKLVPGLGSGGVRC